MISTSSRQFRSSAARIMRPTRGSTGRRASSRPSDVSAGGDRWRPVRTASCSRPEWHRRGRVEKRKLLDRAQFQCEGLQNDRRQVRAPNLRSGVVFPADVILFAIESNADAGSDPAAASFALIGRRLRDGLDRQSLDLGARRVAADARRARVDDGTYAGNGQRGLRHVGCQHHASLRVRLEDPVLFLGGQTRVQRKDIQGISPACDVVVPARPRFPECLAPSARTPGCHPPALDPVPRQPLRL